MGSRQSSENGGGGSFSVDPNGNITKEPSLKSSVSSSNKHLLSGETKRDNIEQQYTNDEKVNQKSNNNNNDHQNLIQAPVIPVIEDTQSFIVSSPQIIPSSKPDSQKNALKEADEKLSNLKNKYKPNSQEMAGKQQSVIEQIENELIQCYSINKHQPLNCETISKNYKNCVRQQRRRILSSSPTNNNNKKANINNFPHLITTILVIITCFLLHINTVTCYGAMSIDLGSEWMKVGLVAPSVQMDIVLNAQSQRKTPMAIAFLNGERYIGDTALDVASKYPEKTYTHFLDLVGKTIEHESVKNYLNRFPYANITSHEPNSTSILLNHPEGFNFTPLELIAMMIQHAHDQVTTRLNSNEPAYDVVITIPPFFEQKERKVIEDAAKLVGLNVLRLTNVNSAFALSYGIFRHKDYLPETTTIENKTTILFFDQGASHTSATLADYHLVEQFDEITGVSKNESLPTVSIRAQVYDRYLGGFDMQLKLRDHLIDAFTKSTKIDKDRIYKRGRSSSKLLKEAGRVKKILSANSDHVVRVENVIDDKDMKLPITRQQFEELNQEYLGNRIKNLLDELFEMPGVNRDERLESVIIVGGNTRTPKIQQVLLDYFKIDSLGKSINADEGAALAALYQAASLGRGFRVKKFVLEEFGEERKRFDPSKIVNSQEVSTPAPESEVSTELPPTETLTTTQSASTSTEEPKDPFSIYSNSELTRMGDKLARFREQDFMRLQRLSMRNSLESLLSEGREKLSDDDEQLKGNKEEIEKLIMETYTWLEEAPQSELDNVTILADKFNAIQVLVRPLPPPTPPPAPEFNPESVDLSSVLNNETLNILDALNFSNPFHSSSEPQNEATTADKQVDEQPSSAGGQKSNATTSDTSSSSSSTISPDEVKVGPSHTEL